MQQKQRTTSLLMLAGALFVAGLIAGYMFFSSPDYSYEKMISGVQIQSSVPFSEVKNWKDMSIINSSDKDALVCSFELSAISPAPSGKGKIIDIRKGTSTGVSITKGKAVIEGSNSENLLKACHAFACLRENMSCPTDFQRIREKITSWKRVNVILDEKVSKAGIRGYGDFLGALGYLQAQTAVPQDLNQDGTIEQWEKQQSIKENMILIFPFTMNKSTNTCTGQPFTSSYQELKTANETFSCDEMDPSIRFIKSEENKLSIEGNQIIVSGDDSHIHTGAILLRDIVAPRFILQQYGLAGN